MLAGKVAHEIGRREDRLTVDQLQWTLLPMPRRVAAGRDTSPVASGQRDDNAVMRGRYLLMLAIPVLLAAGCAVGGSGQPVIGPVGVAEPGVMPFPECQTAELAFAGESTLAAVGLADFAGGPDEQGRHDLILRSGGDRSADAHREGKGGGPAPRVAGSVAVAVARHGRNHPGRRLPPASLTVGDATSDEGVTARQSRLSLVIGASSSWRLVVAFRREGA